MPKGDNSLKRYAGLDGNMLGSIETIFHALLSLYFYKHIFYEYKNFT